MEIYTGRSKVRYYFSIPTSVVRSKQKQKLARMLPLENLMVETDSPVLSPVQGKRNKPSNLPYAIKKISELKRNNFEEIAKITTENARKFFKLPF